jgi:ABC-type nitrate/sulfonate/bicarbonate transport system substrate-binding protein
MGWGMKRLSLSLLLMLVVTAVPACGNSTNGLVPVTLMLDWVPNTNHTGLFVAQEEGYFTDAGLDVKIIQPGEVYPEAAVASGAADFGVSFQEQVTLARAEKIPIVSIAAILQHNTSGFASLSELGVNSPADFEGLSYGAWGSPFEEPTLRVLMQDAGADFGKLRILNVGYDDPLALLAAKKIDLAWIFYGWQGFQAKYQGIDLNVVMMKDYFDYIPDYYTPVLITSEDMISNRPDVVRSFMAAASRGYEYAISKPSHAAAILLSAVPELDPALVGASQEWISSYYQAEAPRWGEQKTEVWQGYTDWMVSNNILSGPSSISDAFTNDFLP